MSILLGFCPLHPRFVWLLWGGGGADKSHPGKHPLGGTDLAQEAMAPVTMQELSDPSEDYAREISLQRSE